MGASPHAVAYTRACPEPAAGARRARADPGALLTPSPPPFVHPTLDPRTTPRPCSLRGPTRSPSSVLSLWRLSPVPLATSPRPEPFPRPSAEPNANPAQVPTEYRALHPPAQSLCQRGAPFDTSQLQSGPASPDCKKMKMINTRPSAFVVLKPRAG